MKAPQRKPRRGLWFRWVILTTLGLASGLIVGLSLGAPIEAIVGMMLVTPIVMAVVGSVLGASQWLVLRQHSVPASWWIVCSAVGLGVGMTVGIVAVETVGGALAGEPVRFQTVGVLGRVAGLAVIGGVAGLSLGVMQWIVLRRLFSRTGAWALRNGLGLGLGLVLGSLVADALLGGVGTPVGFTAFLVVGGLLAGMITGMSILQMAPQSPRRN